MSVVWPEVTDVAVFTVYLLEAGLNISAIEYYEYPDKRSWQTNTSKLTAHRCIIPAQSRISFSTLLLVLLLVLMGTGAWAQGATAVLTGTVVDMQGAHVGEADIQLIQLAQGFRRTVKSDGHGVFSVAALSPGQYVLSATHTGFKATIIRNIVLNVNANLEILVTLKVADDKQTVTVYDRPSLTSTSGAVSNVIDRQFIQDLPLDGRSIQALITLSPGVQLVPVAGANPGQFSVNGMRSNTNYFTIDGVSANFAAGSSGSITDGSTGSTPAVDVQGGFSNLVSIDALQEFQIQTSSFAPEFGRSPGAQISMVTRSGELKFHGSAYDYFRNDALDAEDWFSDYLDTGKQALRYNDFGGTFGGPIAVPGYKDSNKQTFFFFSYEGTRFTQPAPASPTIVPSLAARTGAPTAVTSEVLNAFPIPNGAEIGQDGNGDFCSVGSPGCTATGGALFTSGYSNPSRSNSYGLRLDQKLGSKFSLFARYNRANSSSLSRGSSELANVTGNYVNTDTLTVGTTVVFTPHLLNEFTINGSSQRNYVSQYQDTFGGSQPMPASVLEPGSSCTGCAGTIVLMGLANATSLLPTTSLSISSPVASKSRQINGVDSVTYESGKHQFKVGADYRYGSPVVAPASLTVAQTFQGIPAFYAQQSYVNALAYQEGYALAFKDLSVFAQDTWRANRNLTLTFGTRWELDPAPTGKNGKDPLTVTSLNLNTLDFNYLTLAPKGTPLYKTSYTNFAPRLGFAYLFGKARNTQTVLRGGGGIFYDTGQNSFGQASFPYSQIAEFLGIGFPIPGLGQAGLPGYPALTLPVPIQYATPPPNTATPSATYNTITVAAPNYKLPRSYEWNLTLEQSFGPSSVFSIGYVASAGQDLQRLLNYSFASAPSTTGVDVPYSDTFGGLRVITNGARSHYNSLQATFHSRLSHSLEAMLNYTWSHSIDDASDDTVASSIDNPRVDLGDSTFDVRNSFNGALTYNVPAFQTNRILSAFLNGWALNSIVSARTALPFDVYTYGVNTQSVNGGTYELRASLVPDQPEWIYSKYLPGATNLVPGGKLLNSNAFQAPDANATQGTLPRDSLRGFGSWQVDFGLHRSFTLKNQVKLEFRSEFFNIFNHPNFANPGANSDTNLFGYPTEGAPGFPIVFGESGSTVASGVGGQNALFQTGGPRAIQMALRLSF
jgi:Carboxypeptidase regulatory-like domain/TonB-dependent Receptor Plug Domain